MTHARQWCELLARQMRLMRDANQGEPAERFPCEVLLDRGVEWTERAPSPWKGPAKFCFWNAQRLAGRRKGLRYCEGYATGVIPVEHAWCIDAAGRVIDPTWSEDYQPDYFGLPLDLKLVRRIVRRSNWYSALFYVDNWLTIHASLEASKTPAAGLGRSQNASEGGRPTLRAPRGRGAS